MPALADASIIVAGVHAAAELQDDARRDIFESDQAVDLGLGWIALEPVFRRAALRMTRRNFMPPGVRCTSIDACALSSSELPIAAVVQIGQMRKVPEVLKDHDVAGLQMQHNIVGARPVDLVIRRIIGDRRRIGLVGLTHPDPHVIRFPTAGYDFTRAALGMMVWPGMKVHTPSG